MLGSKEGVTDQNLLQYLGIIEARANQLLLTRAFIIKHQVGTSAARALALLSKTVQQKYCVELKPQLARRWFIKKRSATTEGPRDALC